MYLECFQLMNELYNAKIQQNGNLCSRTTWNNNQTLPKISRKSAIWIEFDDSRNVSERASG